MINNKEENPLKYYMEKLSDMDAQSVARRCALYSEADSVSLRFLSQDYTISIPGFEIACEGSPRFRPFDKSEARILILHFLTEGAGAATSGKFLTYREIPWGEVYYRNFEGRCIKRLAYAFGNDPEAFAAAAQALGGTKLDDGDISYEIQFLESLSMKLILWKADEEFPPASQILFSDNFTVAFTAEDMAAVGDIMIDALKASAK